MKFEFQYGRETADQHYGRGSLSLQAVMTHANRIYDEVGAIPVKTCHHFFGPHGAEANHHFTIFSVPKNALRREVYNRAAAGGIGQTSNPSTGFSDAREAVQYLSQHRSFSPQFTSSGPDRMGFELRKRYALEADLGKTRYGNLYFSLDNLTKLL